MPPDPPSMLWQLYPPVLIMKLANSPKFLPYHFQFCSYAPDFTHLCCITGLLFTLFEPLIGNSIQYANGQDWEDRRKWLYESLKGSYLESYVSHFVKVNYV